MKKTLDTKVERTPKSICPAHRYDDRGKICFMKDEVCNVRDKYLCPTYQQYIGNREVVIWH